MQQNHPPVVKTEPIVQLDASVEDLGLEVVEDTPQIALDRPVRHIRAQ